MRSSGISSDSHRTPRLSREQLAALAEHRLHPKSAAHPAPSLPTGSSEVQRGRQMRLEDVRRRRDEMQLMRRERAEKWRTTAQGRHRVITLDDLERMRREEVEQPAAARHRHGQRGGIPRHRQGGGRLTNVFRREQGREPDVEWARRVGGDRLEAQQGHGRGRASSSATTASRASAARLMRMSAAGENVFMCQGVAGASVAKMAVDGWANSPGHRRKNMLASWRYCGIGVYRNGSGGYYLTQLFGNPDNTVQDVRSARSITWYVYRCWQPSY